jgi:hypothetical protein
MRVCDLEAETLARVTEEAHAIGEELGVKVLVAKPRSGVLPECLKGVVSGHLPEECRDCTFTHSVICGG